MFEGIACKLVLILGQYYPLEIFTMMCIGEVNGALVMVLVSILLACVNASIAG